MMAAALLLNGCARLLHGFAPDCHKRQEYQRAAQVAPLAGAARIGFAEYPRGAGDPDGRGLRSPATRSA